MITKIPVVTALGAALLVTACGSATVQDRLAVTRSAALLPFGKTQAAADPQTQAIPVAWEVLASPVTIAPPSVTETAPSRVGGHAILRAAAHDVPKRYEVKWSGLRDSTATEPTRLTLKDANGDRALVLQFEENRLRVINGAEDTFPQLTFSASKTHHVTAILTTGPKPTVAIDIRQGKIPLYATPPIVVLDKGFDGFGALEIEAGGAGTTYHIADFQALPTKR